MKKTSTAVQSAPTSRSSIAKVSNDFNSTKTQFKVEHISPEMAQEWVSNTKDKLQRKSHESTVKEYVKYMKNGEWVLNYEPIILSVNKSVLDGLHRLKACIASGVSFPSLVVYNSIEAAENEMFNTYDRGTGRTLGDVLSARKIHYSNATASTANLYHQLINNRIGIAADSSRGSSPSGTNKHFRLSPKMLLDFIEKEEGFIDFVAHAARVQAGGSKLLMQAKFIGLWYFCHKHDAKKADSFFTSLSVGANLPESSPVFFLRKKLSDYRNGVSGLKSKQVFNLILRCFEMYCNGEKVNIYIRVADDYRFSMTPQLPL